MHNKGNLYFKQAFIRVLCLMHGSILYRASHNFGRANECCAGLTQLLQNRCGCREQWNGIFLVFITFRALCDIPMLQITKIVILNSNRTMISC